MKISKADLAKLINEELENFLGEEDSDKYKDRERGMFPDKNRGMFPSESEPKVNIKLRSIDNRNKEYELAINDFLKKKENKFLESVLAHIKSGKNISPKQRSIVDKILGR